MEQCHLNKFIEMVDVLKEYSTKLDSFTSDNGGLYSLELSHKSKHYIMDYGKFKNNIFFVLIDLTADSDYKYMCSVNNYNTVPYDSFELYNVGDEPSVYVPFPDEFTQDSYFNLITMHDMHNIPLELLQSAHEFYSLVKAKF